MFSFRESFQKTSRNDWWYRRKKIKETEDKSKQLGHNELLLPKKREIFHKIYKDESIKQMNYLKKNDYDDLKFIVNSNILEVYLSELKNPAAFLIVLNKVKSR